MYACSYCFQVYKNMFNWAKIYLKHTESVMPHSKLPSLKYNFLFTPALKYQGLKSPPVMISQS